MIPELEDLKNSFSGKPTWSAKECAAKCQSISDKLKNKLSEIGKIEYVQGSGIPKTLYIENIKQHDILYLKILGGVYHYFIVFKVNDKRVVCLCLSSTYKESNHLHTIKYDRTFAGNYVTNLLVSIELHDAQNSFVRTFECKRESGRIFKKITKNIITIF